MKCQVCLKVTFTLIFNIFVYIIINKDTPIPISTTIHHNKNHQYLFLGTSNINGKD